MVTVIGNIHLTVFKLIAGFIGHYSAMISDTIHSGSDVLSTFVVTMGVKLSHKKSDIEHPYGHKRFECAAAIILAIMLGITGIGISGINMMFQNNTIIPVTNNIALVCAIISIWEFCRDILGAQLRFKFLDPLASVVIKKLFKRLRILFIRMVV